MNVHPEDVEAALVAEGVVEPCVYDAGAGRIAVAYRAGAAFGDPVEGEAAAVARAVKAANAQLAPHQRVVEHAPFPEPDFPRTHTRKVQRSVVAAQHARGARGGLTAREVEMDVEEAGCGAAMPDMAPMPTADATAAPPACPRAVPGRREHLRVRGDRARRPQGGVRAARPRRLVSRDGPQRRRGLQRRDLRRDDRRALAVGQLAASRIEDHREAKRAARELTADLLVAFEAEFGATTCRALTGSTCAPRRGTARSSRAAPGATAACARSSWR